MGCCCVYTHSLNVETGTAVCAPALIVYRELEATYSDGLIFGLIPDSDGLIPKALVDEATDIPAIMLFDSCYAANMVTGR